MGALLSAGGGAGQKFLAFPFYKKVTRFIKKGFRVFRYSAGFRGGGGPALLINGKKPRSKRVK
jgi:hypothetical protein